MDPKRKTMDKWVSAILSIIFPGVGHFYLGYASRGLIVIGALIVDIALIVFVSMYMFVVFPLGIALVTLLSLVLPVIYFFSIFDVLQLAERKHAYTDSYAVTHAQSLAAHGPSTDELEWPEEVSTIHETPSPRSATTGSRVLGIVLIVIGVVLMISFLLPSPFMAWLFNNGERLFAVGLLAVGGWLIWKQWDRKKGDYR